MSWQPIETYDALKNRPKDAVFYFEASKSGRVELPPTIQLSRNFGFRVCTHWMPLPEPPK